MLNRYTHYFIHMVFKNSIINLTKLKNNKRITRSQYIKYRMAIRDEFNVFILGRRLFQ